MTTIKYCKAVLKYSEDDVYLDIDASVSPANKGCDVTIVYTYDEWRTPRSRNGSYLKNSYADESLYRISVCVTHIPRNSKIWFALKVVEFKSCGGECSSWDNNNGINHEVILEKLPQICLPKEPEVPKPQPSSSPLPRQEIATSQQVAKSQKIVSPQQTMKTQVPQSYPLPLPLPLPLPTSQPQIKLNYYQQPLPAKSQPQVVTTPKKLTQTPKPSSQSTKQQMQPKIQVVQNPIQRSPTLLFTPQKEQKAFSPHTQKIEYTNRLYRPPDYLPDHCITSMLKGHRRMYDEFIY